MLRGQHACSPPVRRQQPTAWSGHHRHRGAGAPRTRGRWRTQAPWHTRSPCDAAADSSSAAEPVRRTARDLPLASCIWSLRPRCGGVPCTLSAGSAVIVCFLGLAWGAGQSIKMIGPDRPLVGTAIARTLRRGGARRRFLAHAAADTQHPCAAALPARHPGTITPAAPPCAHVATTRNLRCAASAKSPSR